MQGTTAEFYCDNTQEYGYKIVQRNKNRKFGKNFIKIDEKTRLIYVGKIVNLYYQEKKITVDKKTTKHIFLEELYFKYKTNMFHVANRILKDTYMAEDAVSEAFIKIAKSQTKILELGQKEQQDYVLILTKNTALDIWRKRQNVVVNIEEAATIPNLSTVDDTVLSNIGYMRILQTIEEMDDKFKDPLKLYCFYEHTVDEIAAIMGMKTHTVYYRIACAKKKLLESLKEKED